MIDMSRLSLGPAWAALKLEMLKRQPLDQWPCNFGFVGGTKPRNPDCMKVGHLDSGIDEKCVSKCVPILATVVSQQSQFH